MVREDEERDILTSKELKKLFESKEYQTEIHKKASLYRVPLLGLLTGARQNELCQLYLDDIVYDENNNIGYIDINQKADKTLKQTSHIRQVPIHQQLIRLGFLEYVDSIKSQGQLRLFPELPKKEMAMPPVFQGGLMIPIVMQKIAM